MARQQQQQQQQHSVVEYIGSPQPYYDPHYQQPPTLQQAAGMSPISPPFSGNPMPPPPPPLPPPYPLPQPLLPPAPNHCGHGMQEPQPHQARLTHVPLPPPNFAINNGSYPLSHMTLPPPSISWITHTQSPPLHPFPPPTTPLTHIHTIQPPPPRLSHSPAIPPHTGYPYHHHHDPSAAAYMQVQPYPQAPPGPDLHHHHHHPSHHHHHQQMHSMSPDIPGMQPASHQIHGAPPPPPPPPHYQLLSPPSYNQQQLQEAGGMSQTVPHLYGQPLPPPPPPQQQQQPLPVRDVWMRSPPPPGPQIHQLPSALNHIPVLPQPSSQSVPPQAARVQFLPPTPAAQTAPRIGKAVAASGPMVTPPAATQVSEQLKGTTVQLLQTSLQPVSMSTIVRPSPVYATQTPPGFQSATSESSVPDAAVPGPSPLRQQQQVSAAQHSAAEQQWMPAESRAPPPNCLQTSSTLTSSPQGSATDRLLQTTQPMSLPMSSHEARELDEYNEFANVFKNHRLKLGYTHADVIQQVGIRYGFSFSMDTIAQFEEVHLPLSTVRTLRPVLQMWLKDTAKAAGTSEEEMKEIIVHASTSINPKRERKRRTTVDSVIKGQLEEEFRKKRTPSQSEMQTMANRLGMEKDFIRVWFCNRRQRQKKIEKELKMRARRSSGSSPKATIPSPSHDITVEVPSIDPRDAGSPIHEDYKFRRTV